MAEDGGGEETEATQREIQRKKQCLENQKEAEQGGREGERDEGREIQRKEGPRERNERIE